MAMFEDQTAVNLTEQQQKRIERKKMRRRGAINKKIFKECSIKTDQENASAEHKADTLVDHSNSNERNGASDSLEPTENSSFDSQPELSINDIIVRH